MPKVRANGVDIEYESFGREGDPVILLIGGFAASLTLWPDSLLCGLAAKGFDNRDIWRSSQAIGDFVAKVEGRQSVRAAS